MKRISPVISSRLTWPPVTARTEAELLRRVGQMMRATTPRRPHRRQHR